MSSQITPVVKHTPRAALNPAGASWIKPLAAAAIMSLLGLTAALLVFRRLASALHEPLAIPQLAIAACGFAAAALAVRLLSKSDFGKHAPTRPRLGRSLTIAAPSAFVLAAAVSLSLPGTHPAGLAVLWAIIAAAEICFFARAAFGSGNVVPNSLSRFTTTAHKPSPRPPREFPACGDGPPGNMEEADSGITQQLVRRQGPDGAETMAGILQATFLPAQRTATVHVAFCPPFSALPSLEVEQIDGPPSRVKTVQLLPYGARFDIKLSKDAQDPLAVSLRFSARV